MRVGIVGTGAMGTTHAASWAETPAQIAGFCAETVAGAAALADQYRAKAFVSLEAMLPEVDVVDICTPTYLHPEQVRLAAAAGKDIVCEKPLALDVKSAAEMLKICDDAGVRLLVAHVLRYFPEYAAAKKMVTEGKLGKPGTIHLRRCNYRPKKAAGNWFLDDRKSGGLLMDLSIHDFDYARWVAGEVETVFSATVSAVNHDAPIDYALTILTHENGALTHVIGGWAYPAPNFQTGLDINCERGNIRFDSVDSSPIRVLIREDGNAPDVGLPGSPLAESPYTAQLREFYNAITDGAEVRVTALDGLKAVQIACAARESVAAGMPVSIESLSSGGVL